MSSQHETPPDTAESLLVSSRTVHRNRARFHLSNGLGFESRRFLPLGKGDSVALAQGDVWVLVKRDRAWINVTRPWTKSYRVQVAGKNAKVTIKEIDSVDELAHFSTLQTLHYRGAGGAGRTAPLIGTCDIWDLPAQLGFIEISSSMIANSARTRLLNFPYHDPTGIHWQTWNNTTARSYSNLICRISRFVIHPEIRGLGLAKVFTDAAIHYSNDRWHFGGYRPRFLEITADMLRYYSFLDHRFLFVGETQGNEHRLQKDMTYLARRAIRAKGSKGMPQGGGGIMTLQRGYANKLLEYTSRTGKTLTEVIESLRVDASSLDQETWEALYRLNRKPKPCYMAGLTPASRDFMKQRDIAVQTAVCDRHGGLFGRPSANGQLRPPVFVCLRPLLSHETLVSCRTRLDLWGRGSAPRSYSPHRSRSDPVKLP